MKGVAVVFVVVGVLAAALVMTRGDPGTDQRLPISLAGRSFSLAARVFRPAGSGPFPLVIINHGVPVSLDDVGSTQLGYTRAAHWFKFKAIWLSSPCGRASELPMALTWKAAVPAGIGTTSRMARKRPLSRRRS